MEKLKVPTLTEYPKTVFKALQNLADFPGDTVTVQNLHQEIIGHDIFPEDGKGESWVRGDLKRGMYAKYVGKESDLAALAWKDARGQWRIKKPLAAMIVADVIHRAMEKKISLL